MAVMRYRDVNWGGGVRGSCGAVERREPFPQREEREKKEGEREPCIGFIQEKHLLKTID